MKAGIGAVAAVVAAIVLATAGYFWLGFYDVAADEPHWRVTENFLETARERSIERRSSGIAVPALDDEAMVRTGAGNYDSMCADCHLRPGEDGSALKDGLNPRPPDLTRRARDPKETFWAVRHGIKMTGMPAWGGHMDDQAIWQIVAFTQRLPELSAEEYRSLVAASGGHSHGGPKGGGHAEHQDAAADGPAAVVDRFHAALAKGDFATVEALLDPEVLVLESGGAERSAAEYLAHHAKADADFLRGARQQRTRRSARVEGGLAWIGSEGTLSKTHDGKALELVTSETMVLKKGEEGWKVVHIHWSSRARKN